MIARPTQQLAVIALLLFCSTQHFTVDSAKAYKNDFYTIPRSTRPFISSKIIGKQVYVTPYYVSTGVQALHNMGFKGKGVKLGIIDSGANKNSIAFKENFKYKHNFVVTAHNQTEDSSECTKRGKRLTGIVIANSNYFTGIAPEVTFGSYRVFGCKGPTSTSLVLQAIKAAIKDQMKIIVLPEIAIVDEYDTQLGQEIEDAAKHGVIMIVAASVNNFIKQQYFSYQGLPVLSVGGFKQEYRLSHWFEEKTTGRRIEFTSSCSNMSYNFNKEADIIPKNIKGKLIEYTGLKRQDIALVWYDKSKMPYFLEYAKSIGMAGLIIVNGPSKKKQKCDIPLFDISEKDALFIKEGYRNKLGYKYIFAEKYGYTEDGGVTVDTAGPQNEPLIPPFYPDILAPSYKIYTTTTRKTISKPYFSDISAAVAYVAGAAALIVQHNQYSSIDITSIKTILQNNAIPVKHSNINNYVSVEYQGAGMINLNKLIDNERIHVEPSSINMKNTFDNTANLHIKVTSLFDTALSYKISHIPAAAASKVSYFIDMTARSPVTAAVSFPGSINLQPKQKGEIMIRISTPMNIQKNEIWSYSGYIVLDPNPRFDKPPSDRAVFVPYYGIVRG